MTHVVTYSDSCLCFNTVKEAEEARIRGTNLLTRFSHRINVKQWQLIPGTCRSFELIYCVKYWKIQIETWIKKMIISFSLCCVLKRHKLIKLSNQMLSDSFFGLCPRGLHKKRRTLFFVLLLHLFHKSGEWLCLDVTAVMFLHCTSQKWMLSHPVWAVARVFNDRSKV